MITIAEHYDSRRTVHGQSHEIVLTIDGTNNDVYARSVSIAMTPPIYENLVRQPVEVEPIGYRLWRATVRYAKFDKQQDDQPEITERIGFDTTGGSQHITHSLKTIDKFTVAVRDPDDADAVAAAFIPDCKGLIGVNGDQVAGADIGVPQLGFSITKKFLPGQFTQAIVQILYRMSFTVNVKPWRGFQPHEVLFQGASMPETDVAREEAQVTYKFAASPNVDNLQIGDIKGIKKRGWDYLWVRELESVDAKSKQLIRRPAGVYIEQVYRETDFSQLRLDGPFGGRPRRP